MEMEAVRPSTPASETASIAPAYHELDAIPVLPPPPAPFPLDYLRHERQDEEQGVNEEDAELEAEADHSDQATICLHDAEDMGDFNLVGIQRACAETLAILLPHNAGAQLSEQDRPLAAAVSDLLEASYDLEAYHTSSTKSAPIAPFDRETSPFFRLDHVLSSSTNTAALRSQPRSPQEARRTVHEELTWARVQSLIDNVVQLVRERTERDRQSQQTLAVSPPAYRQSVNSLASDCQSLQSLPAYTDHEHDEMVVSESNDTGAKSKTSDDAKSRLAEDGKDISPMMHGMMTGILNDLDTVTHAIERLQAIAPQLQNQRVELRAGPSRRRRLDSTSHLSQPQNERERMLELEDLWDKMDRVNSSRSIILDGQRIEMSDRQKEKQPAREINLDDDLYMDDTPERRALEADMLIRIVEQSSNSRMGDQERPLRTMVEQRQSFIDGVIDRSEASRLTGQDCPLSIKAPKAGGSKGRQSFVDDVVDRSKASRLTGQDFPITLEQMLDGRRSRHKHVFDDDAAIDTRSRSPLRDSESDRARSLSPSSSRNDFLSRELPPAANGSVSMPSSPTLSHDGSFHSPKLAVRSVEPSPLKVSVPTSSPPPRSSSLRRLSNSGESRSPLLGMFDEVNLSSSSSGGASQRSLPVTPLYGIMEDTTQPVSILKRSPKSATGSPSSLPRSLSFQASEKDLYSALSKAAGAGRMSNQEFVRPPLPLVTTTFDDEADMVDFATLFTSEPMPSPPIITETVADGLWASRMQNNESVTSLRLGGGGSVTSRASRASRSPRTPRTPGGFIFPEDFPIPPANSRRNSISSIMSSTRFNQSSPQLSTSNSFKKLVQTVLPPTLHLGRKISKASIKPLPTPPPPPSFEIDAANLSYVTEHQENLRAVQVLILGLDATSTVDLQLEVMSPTDAILVSKDDPTLRVLISLPTAVKMGQTVSVAPIADYYEAKLAAIPTATSTLSLNSSLTHALSAPSLRDIAPRSLCCTACDRVVAQFPINVQYKDLPSEHWAEMLEVWMCHADPAFTAQLAKHTKDGFWPSQDTVLVGGSYLLVSGSHICDQHLVPELSNEPDQWRIVTCPCGEVLGKVRPEDGQPGAGTVRFSKWSIALLRGTGADDVEPVRFPVSTFVVSDMLELAQAHASHRFIICDEQTGDRRLAMWVFNPSVSIAYQRNPNSPPAQLPPPLSPLEGEGEGDEACSRHPRPSISTSLPDTYSLRASKIMFKVLEPYSADAEFEHLPGFGPRGQVEHLRYSRDACVSLIAVLRASSALYPATRRTMGSFDVGFLERT